MEKKQYTARILKPTNRESWVIEFRHPLAKDSRGKIGKKIRRGLGTTDESEANLLLNQMNEILSDESLWSPINKLRAKEKYDDGIVNAFFDEVEYKTKNHSEIRENELPIRNLDEGYSKVLLLGSTGAGKTTLLRQLMGTNPETERFPATSTAKTTVFDTEIIFSNGSYKGIVTFFSESETREMIKESIRDSMIEYFLTKNESHLLRVLLEDKEQRFRLGYIIGKIKPKKILQERNREKISNENAEDIKASTQEQIEIERKINEFVEMIKKMTTEVIIFCKEKYSTNNPSEEENKIMDEIIESEINDYDADDISDLTDLILEEIKKRFETLDESNTVREKFGWPIYWKIDTAVRQEFLDKIRFFSGNSSQMFGKLLTPLVSGMRVQGPFKPEYISNIPKLVIFDGEGLGHIPDTTSSVSSSIIEKFKYSDAIILVDNAQNPMQAAPYAVIKAVAISGHYKKLALCFTHFESVKGDNIPEVEDRMEHVFSSVDNILDNLETNLEHEVKKFLINHFTKTSYYLSDLDQHYSEDDKFNSSKEEIKRLINIMESASNQIQLNSEISLTYELYPLMYKIQNAAKRFHKIWDGYLFGTSEIQKAHFAKIKALSRRLGHGWENEYKELKPIADFWDSFNSQISSFLNSPIQIIPSNPNEDDVQDKIDMLKQMVSSDIYEYAIERIKNDMVPDWQEAYDKYIGYKGCASDRADRIKHIYEDTVPIPENELNELVNNFVKDIMNIIKDKLESSNCKLNSIFEKIN